MKAPPAPPPTRPAILARLAPDGPGVVSGSAVVTSVEPAATRAGITMLERGGNAVDAAVATAFALAVTHPSAGNVGGGGFLILSVGGKLEAIDFREDAPLALDDARFRKLISAGGRGRDAVGVPGTVSGLLLAHERHGRLSLEVVLTPAIELAEKGYVLGARQAKVIGWSEAVLRADAPSGKLFLPGGQLPGKGNTLRNPGLAHVLRLVAKEGARGFYRGEVADDLISSLGPGALLTREDLARYRAEIREPLSLDYQGLRVHTMPPPSGGGVAVAQSLAMLGALPIGSTTPGDPVRYHLLIEVGRRAQAERRLFVGAPSLDTAADAAERKRAMDPNTWLAHFPIALERKTDPSALSPHYAQALDEVDHTTHLSVVDADGGAVSCTVTLSGSFGAGITTKNTGIVLNNAVASFGSVGVNLARPGVRTISSMAPTLVQDGEQTLFVLGSPGGDTIPSTITQVLLHLLDGLSLKAAVDAPRLHQGFVPDEVQYERERPLSPELRKALSKLGHRLAARRAVIGDANIAALWEGRALAVSDEREGGLALGTTHTAVAVPTP